jgi:hypothetical protein
MSTDERPPRATTMTEMIQRERGDTTNLLDIANYATAVASLTLIGILGTDGKISIQDGRKLSEWPEAISLGGIRYVRDEIEEQPFAEGTMKILWATYR